MSEQDVALSIQMTGNVTISVQMPKCEPEKIKEIKDLENFLNMEWISKCRLEMRARFKKRNNEIFESIGRKQIDLYITKKGLYKKNVAVLTLDEIINENRIYFDSDKLEFEGNNGQILELVSYEILVLAGISYRKILSFILFLIFFIIVIIIITLWNKLGM